MVDPVSLSMADIVVKVVRPIVHEIKKQAWPPCAKRSADKKVEHASRLVNAWSFDMTVKDQEEVREEVIEAQSLQRLLNTMQRDYGLRVFFVGSWWTTTRKYRRLARIAHNDAVTASNSAQVNAVDPSLGNGRALRNHPKRQAPSDDGQFVIEMHSATDGTIYNNIFDLSEHNDQPPKVLVLNSGRSSQVNNIFTRDPRKWAAMIEKSSGQSSESPICGTSRSGESAREVASPTLEDILQLSEKEIDSLFKMLKTIKKQSSDGDDAASGEDEATPVDDDRSDSEDSEDGTESHRALVIGATVPQDDDTEESVHLFVGLGDISYDDSQTADCASGNS